MANNGVGAPLLKKDYYENCSGCKVEQMKERQRGLPFKQLFTIWIIVLCAGNLFFFSGGFFFFNIKFGLKVSML